jgi:hypothetical protein
MLITSFQTRSGYRGKDTNADFSKSVFSSNLWQLMALEVHT